MSTASGARIYRRAPKPLHEGACPQCNRVISINKSGHRRDHRNTEGRRCTGGGVFVGEPTPVWLDDLPDVVVPSVSLGNGTCPGCGQRPRVKGDGAFASHRIDVDDPSSPRCPNGAKLGRQ